MSKGKEEETELSPDRHGNVFKHTNNKIKIDIDMQMCTISFNIRKLFLFNTKHTIQAQLTTEQGLKQA